MKARLVDLEARSRQNNIRIHGVQEGAEGDNLCKFLDVPDSALAIQWCHRSLGVKPLQGANLRSMVVYFLQFKMKELVLRSVWKKKEIKYEGRRVFFFF